jgi:hypothetical protein
MFRKLLITFAALAFALFSAVEGPPARAGVAVPAPSFTPPTACNTSLTWNYATAGNSSFTYNTRSCRYEIVNGRATVNFYEDVTPTIGTGSGELQITLPFTCIDTNGGAGVAWLSSGPWTWTASRTSPMLANTTTSKIAIEQLGSAGNAITIAASNMATGASHLLVGTFSCFTS